jgi:hypothetical protein
VPTADDILIEHVTPLHPVTHVRSTLLQSSLHTLRGRGHFEAYVAELEASYHDDILHTLAPTWLPIRAGVAHYRACDALSLHADELLAIGSAVGDRIQGTFMRTLTQSARAAGLTPWTLLTHFRRLWDRLFQGGSVSLARVGPKDALIEVRCAVLPRFEYFRHAFCGVVSAGVRFGGARTAFVRAVAWDSVADCLVMRAAWV